MGFMTVITECAACRGVLSANPRWCPSIRVDGGSRQPICRECFDLWNRVHREAKGLEPVALHPQAYSWLSELEEKQ